MKDNQQEFQFELYSRMMDTRKNHTSYRAYDHAMSLRMPLKQAEILDKVCNEFAKKFGVHISKTDLINWIIIMVFNLEQDKNNPRNVYTKKNKASILHYIEENKPSLQEMFKEELFQARLDKLNK